MKGETMKILFVHHKLYATFIKNDLDILRKHYDVVDFEFSIKKIPQLIKEIKKCELVYIWFISYPAYFITILNRLFKYKKPIILVAGGYGVQGDIIKNHKIFRLMVKSTIRNSREVFAVSKFTKKELINLNINFKYDIPIRVIYNGVDFDLFRNLGLRNNEKPIVLTVGVIDSWYRYYLKGIDRFTLLAKRNPHMEFYVIGITKKIGKKVKNIPSNMHFLLPMRSKELVYFYNKANIYCQFSRYESFCLTLLESIACGCKPYVSKGNGMDEIMLMKDDAKDFEKMFSLKNRERNLVRYLDEFKKV